MEAHLHLFETTAFFLFFCASLELDLVTNLFGPNKMIEEEETRARSEILGMLALKRLMSTQSERRRRRRRRRARGNPRPLSLPLLVEHTITL